jgi:phenylacetate-CoA ligase
MRTLDRLRTAYAGSPPWMRRSASLVVGVLPVRLTLGHSFQEMRDTIRRCEADPIVASSYRRDQLAQLMRNARRTPYYAEVFSQLDRRGSETPELFDLPILTRDTVAEQGERLLSVPRSSVDASRTSGSSGASITVFLDRDRSVREWAFITHIWSRIGYRLGDSRALMRGHTLPDVDDQPWEYDRGLRELRLSPFHLAPDVIDRYLEQISSRRIRYIHGHPSAVTLLARYAQSVGWQPVESIRGVLAMSEPLYSHQRQVISEVLSPNIMPFYGLSEKVAIAGEVKGHPGRYEFEPCYGAAEVVSPNGHPVEEGQYGRLVSTGFICKSMPLLRYDTGDTCRLVQSATEGNGFRLVVEDLQPRTLRDQEYLVKESGTLVPMNAVDMQTAAMESIHDYLFVQTTPGEVQFRVVPRPGATLEDVQVVVKELNRKIGAGLTFHLTSVAEIPAGPRGKRRFLVQELDLSHFGAGTPWSG